MKSTGPGTGPYRYIVEAELKLSLSAAVQYAFSWINKPGFDLHSSNGRPTVLRQIH